MAVHDSVFVRSDRVVALIEQCSAIVETSLSQVNTRKAIKSRVGLRTEWRQRRQRAPEKLDGTLKFTDRVEQISQVSERRPIDRCNSRQFSHVDSARPAASTRVKLRPQNSYGQF